MNFMYVDGYKEDEQQILEALGLTCFRFSKADLYSGDAFTCLPTSNTYQVRANRMSLSEYNALYELCKSHHMTLATTNLSYEILSSPEKQSSVLSGLTPKMVIFSRDCTGEALMQAADEAQFSYPIFARTEIESAAKYVGVAGCMIKQKEKEQFETVLRAMRDHIKNYQRVILKEVVEIAKDPTTGSALEFRAVGCGGALLMFDYDVAKFSVGPEQLGLHEFAARALRTLASEGADGGIFIDVAVLSNGTSTVIECKNLLNGTINSVRSFGEAVLKYGKSSWSL